MKKFWFFILVILVGGLAGVLVSQFLTPYLAHTSPFNKISWLKQVNNGTTIINPKEEKIIKEDTAIEDAIRKISPAVVGIVSKSTAVKTKKVVSPVEIYGTGFLVTSDGLVVAASSTVLEKNFEYSVVLNGESFLAETKKRDDELGLVLLKIVKTNLAVVSFDDLDNLRLGERVVMVGIASTSDSFKRFVDWGIIRSMADKMFTISIEDADITASGAPLINVEGEVMGMVVVGADGAVKVVTAEQVRKFIEQ